MITSNFSMQARPNFAGKGSTFVAKTFQDAENILKTHAKGGTIKPSTDGKTFVVHDVNAALEAAAAKVRQNNKVGKFLNKLS